MLIISSACEIFCSVCVVYFAEDVEEWFGCGKSKVFCHISAPCLSFCIKYK